MSLDSEFESIFFSNVLKFNTIANNKYISVAFEVVKKLPVVLIGNISEDKIIKKGTITYKFEMLFDSNKNLFKNKIIGK